LLVTGAGVLATISVLVALPALPTRAENLVASNIVERYQQQLENGTAKLAYADDGRGYLPSILRAFNIPRHSQLLVFSASSLQFDKINQKTPRALYYQDNVSVGAVLDGHLIEIIATDRDSGVAFYTLDTTKSDKPRFVRRTKECTTCHGYVSRWAPGLMVATYSTGPGGKLLNLDPYNPFRLTDDRTPFEDRYGGWYVTGKTGAMRHRGNVTIDPKDPLVLAPGGTNVPGLGDRIDIERYLEPGSDIVSLLTLEHQAGFVNLTTRINAQYRSLDNKDATSALRATDEEIDASINELISYMTFAKEAPLPSPVTGTSGFTKTFSEGGSADAKGRSLRQFDLETRVFRYPLSYMIYSQAFDNLSALAKDRVLRRLYEVLRGANDGQDGVDFRARGGEAAINILAATKVGLPDYWKPVPERYSHE
jgi:hypothetical protein